MKINPLHIRNFAIIAHVDHGKSTLADRLLEATNTIPKRAMMEQVLDTNPIERERGITIKLAPVRMKYVLPRSLQKIFNFQLAIFNLIDTPGHVDFSYEVSRSLAACEGVLLLVDATKGIQAQTLAYMRLVKERDLTVIPIINKIDLPYAQIAKTRRQLKETFNFKNNEIIEISAKKGTNIESVFKEIIKKIQPPRVDKNKPFRALVFSSIFDQHKGVIVFIRVMEGSMKKINSSELTYMFMASGKTFTPVEVGYFCPAMIPVDRLGVGEVGYLATGLKNVHLAQVGDTITVNPAYNNQMTARTPLPGYKKAKPMVFLSLFPVDSNAYVQLREALEKLHLSDSSFTFRPISSPALGKGFRCGFLGLLHAEVVQERLEREFYLNLIATLPTVEYRVELTKDGAKTIQSAEELPDPTEIKEIREPIMMVTIFAPKKHIGSIMKLSEKKRGELHDMEYFGGQVKFTYTIPLAEIVIDFFDRLKSVSSGYASLDYEFFSYSPVEVVKLDIFVNHRRVDALSTLVVRNEAYSTGKQMVERLSEVIPRQQFSVPVQAAIGSKIIARSTIKAFRKDVTQKLYGGDRTRKDKLLKKQKKGKKRMKVVGKIEIPKEAFRAVLKK